MSNKDSSTKNKSLLSKYPDIILKSLHHYRIVFKVIFYIVIVIAIFKYLQTSQNDSSTNINAEENTSSQYLLQLPSGSKSISSFLVIKNGAGNQADLFVCSMDSVVNNRNLTNSPVVSETLPIFDSKAETVFYYGITASGIDIYSMNLQSGGTKSLTLHAGNTKLHTEYIITPIKEAALSPDERWIAFPAKDKKKGHTELFVAGTDSQLIWQATQLNAQICDYLWLNNNVLIIAILRDDDKVEYWKAQLDPVNGFSSLVPVNF